MNKCSILLLFSFLLLLTNCDDNDPVVTTPDPDMGGGDPDPMVDEGAAVYPLIMVHGALASGDTYALQAQRFSSNGYEGDYLYTFDWNSVGTADTDNELDALVDEVLAATGERKVNLIGHSAGGGVGYDYLSEASRAAKVNKYVHIASNPADEAAGPDAEIPTLNIYSPQDEIVAGADIEGATNLSIPDQDHYQVATSSETFQAIYNFFHDEMPSYNDVLEEDEILLSGKVVSLGENAVGENVLVQIFELNEADGTRLNAEADHSLMTDAKGHWGSVEVKKNVRYEFEISHSEIEDFKTIHYYREGFTRSDQFVYLRSFPDPTTTAGLLLSGLPEDDAQSVVAVFSANQAVIAGRDELDIEGFELSTPALASSDQTSIAFFLYDDNDDQMSSGNSIFLFSFVPFLNGADVFTATDTPESVTVNFNGRSLNFMNWKSETEGVSVLVFN